MGADSGRRGGRELHGRLPGRRRAARKARHRPGRSAAGSAAGPAPGRKTPPSQAAGTSAWRQEATPTAGAAGRPAHCFRHARPRQGAERPRANTAQRVLFRPGLPSPGDRRLDRARRNRPRDAPFASPVRERCGRPGRGAPVSPHASPFRAGSARRAHGHGHIARRPVGRRRDRHAGPIFPSAPVAFFRKFRPVRVSSAQTGWIRPEHTGNTQERSR